MTAAAIALDDDRIADPIPASSLNREEWFTAVHEAGHACVALLHHRPLGLVALCDVPGAATAGFSSASDDYDSIVAYFAAHPLARPMVPTVALLDRVVVLLAGGVAEARARGIAYDPGLAGGWCDRYQAEHLMGVALHQPPYGSWVRAALSVIEATTRRTIESEWPWIESVAGELLVKRRMSGTDVLALRPRRVGVTARKVSE
jgi:hypothetical protein